MATYNLQDSTLSVVASTVRIYCIYVINLHKHYQRLC